MLSSIVAEARANRMLGTGLFGQGGVQWVIGDGFSPSDFDELSADARAALHGSLQIKAVGAVDDSGTLGRLCGRAVGRATAGAVQPSHAHCVADSARFF